MSLAGFLVRDHCQKCKLMWNVATTAGIFKLLSSLACVITLIAQFLSGCFRAFAHLVLSLYIFPFADLISVDNCLRWALMTGLRRFVIYGGGIFSEGWLDSWKVPAMPRHQPSISTRQWFTDKKEKFFFIHLASNNLSPIWRYPKNWLLFTGKKICSVDCVFYPSNNRGLGSISAFTYVLKKKCLLWEELGQISRRALGNRA